MKIKKVVPKAFALVAAIGLWLAALPSAQAAICSAGQKAQVEWKGSWYPASVTRVSDDGQKCFIHYAGYGSNWDEWVGSDRIKVSGASAPAPAAAASFKVGDLVSVEWKGKWWNASVIDVPAPSKWKIHYDGYDNSWDEVVGPSRIKSR